MWDEWSSLNPGEFIIRKLIYLTEPEERSAVGFQNQTVSKKPFLCLTSVCLSVHLLHSVSLQFSFFHSACGSACATCVLPIIASITGSVTILSRESEEETVGPVGKVLTLDQSTGKCWGYVLTWQVPIQKVSTKQRKNLNW